MATPAEPEEAIRGEAEGGDMDGEKNAQEDKVLTLEDLKSTDVPELARDKFRSRSLQRTLLKGSPEASAYICEKTEPIFMELVRDQYGNYLTQKVLEVCDVDMFMRFFGELQLQLKDLAQDVHGTRAVQKMVEQAIARGKVPELLVALPDELIAKLAKNVTGFHVVVKMVESLPSADAHHVLEVLTGTAAKASALSRDQWGCCVMKKCIDRAVGDSRTSVIDNILENTVQLVQDPFGNYVVQHLIVFGQRPNSYVTRVIDVLKGQVFELALLKFSSNVLEKCLVHSADKDRNKIINEILNPQSCLPSQAVQKLLFHQYGNYVFQQALEVAKEPQFSLLVEHSKQHVQDVVQKSLNGSKQPSGHLAGEHVRRLCMKLVKKHSALSGGLNFEVAPQAWYPGQDPSAYASRFDSDASAAWSGAPMSTSTICGYPYPAWDSMAYNGGAQVQPVAYPPRAQRPRNKGSKVADSGKDGRGKGNDPEKISDQSPGGVVRVGRIVGYWPNYTVTYEEVPQSAGGGGRGARAKNKMTKGKGAGKGGSGSKEQASW